MCDLGCVVPMCVTWDVSGTYVCDLGCRVPMCVTWDVGYLCV